MARRASSKLNPGIIVAIVVAIAVAIFGGKLLLGKKTESFGNVSTLAIDEFL